MKEKDYIKKQKPATEEEYYKCKNKSCSYFETYHNADKYSGKRNIVYFFSGHDSVLQKAWAIISMNTDQLTELETQFMILAEKWKDDTGLYSTMGKKVVNDTYLDIIGLGREIVPFILKDIQNGGTAHWHSALKALTKENPVPEEDLHKNKKIKQAWLNWGTNNKLI